jgi:hypothetical protein
MEEDQPPHRATNSDERNDEASDRMTHQHEVRNTSERLMDGLGTLDGPGCHVIGRKIDRGGSVPSCLQLFHDSIPAPSSEASTMHKTERVHAGTPIHFHSSFLLQ